MNVPGKDHKIYQNVTNMYCMYSKNVKSVKTRENMRKHLRQWASDFTQHCQHYPSLRRTIILAHARDRVRTTGLGTAAPAAPEARRDGVGRPLGRGL